MKKGHFPFKYILLFIGITLITYIIIYNTLMFNQKNEDKTVFIFKHDIEEIKKSIILVHYEATACCDLSHQYFPLSYSGSGVIYKYDGEGNVFALTNRHVISCAFNKDCLYPKDEKITIRTYDGNIYQPTGIFYFLGNIDLAILKFKTNKMNITSAIFSYKNYSIGDKIIAIGYPTVEFESSEPIFQFLVSEGKIRKTDNLLTYRGREFKVIECDAITGKGTSGGGVFDENGYLIGIITWGNKTENKVVAIDVTNILDEDVAVGCAEDSYYALYGFCCPYGTIASEKENKCYEPCGFLDEYCPSPNICCNGKCYSPCPSNYYLGIDCKCHLNETNYIIIPLPPPIFLPFP